MNDRQSPRIRSARLVPITAQGDGAIKSPRALDQTQSNFLETDNITGRTENIEFNSAQSFQLNKLLPKNSYQADTSFVNLAKKDLHMHKIQKELVQIRSPNSRILQQQHENGGFSEALKNKVYEMRSEDTSVATMNKVSANQTQRSTDKLAKSNVFFKDSKGSSEEMGRDSSGSERKLSTDELKLLYSQYRAEGDPQVQVQKLLEFGRKALQSQNQQQFTIYEKDLQIFLYCSEQNALKRLSYIIDIDSASSCTYREIVNKIVSLGSQKLQKLTDGSDISSLQEENKKLRQLNENLQEQLKVFQNDDERKKIEISAEKQTKKFQLQIQNLEGEIKRFQDLVYDLKAKASVAKKEREDNEKILLQQLTYLQELNQQFVSGKSVEDTKASDIKFFELEKLRKEVASKDELIKVQSKELEQIKQKLENLGDERGTDEQKLTELQEENENLKSQLSEREEEIRQQCNLLQSYIKKQSAIQENNKMIPLDLVETLLVLIDQNGLILRDSREQFDSVISTKSRLKFLTAYFQKTTRNNFFKKLLSQIDPLESASSDNHIGGEQSGTSEESNLRPILSQRQIADESTKAQRLNVPPNTQVIKRKQLKSNTQKMTSSPVRDSPLPSKRNSVNTMLASQSKKNMTRDSVSNRSSTRMTTSMRSVAIKAVTITNNSHSRSSSLSSSQEEQEEDQSYVQETMNSMKKDSSNNTACRCDYSPCDSVLVSIQNCVTEDKVAEDCSDDDEKQQMEPRSANIPRQKKKKNTVGCSQFKNRSLSPPLKTVFMQGKKSTKKTLPNNIQNMLRTSVADEIIPNAVEQN